MSYNEWKFRVAQWRAKYGFPAEKSNSPGRNYNPSAVTMRACKKCGSLWKLTRHHKGHEYVFAVIREDWYARRYLEFHPDDVVILCERCHLKIHKLYAGIMEDLNAYLMVTPLPMRGILEEYRLKMVRKCEAWLTKPMKKPSSSVKSRLNKKRK